MNVKVFFALLLAVAAVSSKKISYQRCATSSRGRIIYVDVSPCDQEPCVFRRGSKETIRVSFIPDELITEAKIYAYGIKPGFWRVPLPLDHNVCQGYGLTCPMKPIVPVNFVYSLNIKSMYPPGYYRLEVLIKDQNDNLVICGIIGLEVA